MNYLIGLDIGSTSIKAVVYDEKGNYFSHAQRPTPLSFNDKKNPSWCVWEPLQVWGNAYESLKEAIQKVPNKHDIKGITCTGFAFDGVPLDKNKKPLYPFISWHCPRTNQIYQEFKQRYGSDNFFNITGKTPWNIDPIYRIEWLRRNEPKVFEKIDKYVLIVDYIVLNLTGEIVSDQTMSLSTSVFNIKKCDWDRDLISKLNLPEHIWSKVLPSGSIAGTILPEIALETGLSKKTIITLGGHDFSTAAVAVGAIYEDVVMNVAGTWEMVCAPTKKIKLTEKLQSSGIYADFHSLKDMYWYLCSWVCGDMTEWLKKNLYFNISNHANERKMWAEIDSESSAAEIGSNGCFFLPLFSGSVLDPEDLGAFLGMSNRVSRADMMRSMFEGLNYQFKSVLEKLSGLGVNTKKILVTGGAARSEFWMQNRADIAGVEIETPDLYEATTLGGALVAAIGAGIYKDAFEAYNQTKKPCKQYTPNRKNTEKYTEYYQKVFTKLQPLLNSINHEIQCFRK